MAYKENNKEKMREYYIKNCEKLKRQSKLYYWSHRKEMRDKYHNNKHNKENKKNKDNSWFITVNHNPSIYI